MARIYLSSTYEDLKDYRRVVFEALRKSSHQVIAMENYVATDQRPVDQCLKDVEQADIYVGLFAFRYGYVPPLHHQNPGGLSITELEYRRAETLRKPCLTFVVDDTTAWPRVFDDAYTAEDKGARIKALRQHLLTEKLASSFSAPHELSTLVLAAVAKHLEEHKARPGPGGMAAEAPACVTWDVEKKGSPYPGLMHFTRRYAPVFFGRDAEVREILDRMRGPEGRFIIVSGDSGVGKSSVVDAGVLPHLEEGGLPGRKRCLSVRMLPSQGKHPFSALMNALHPYATKAGLKPELIAEELSNAPHELTGHLRAILADGMDCDALVLFVDQMEELFTAQNPAQAKEFLKALYNTAQDGSLWVLATIRGDHLHHCHGHPDMLRILRGAGHYPLGRVEPFMLADMIVKPARCAGVRVSDDLARRIMHEAGSEPGNLPLLAFLLNQLFEQREDHELSAGVYKALDGVAGAVKKHAEQVEASIRQKDGEKALALLPKLFQSLVIVNAEGVPTRRRPLISQFSEDMSGLLKTLVDARLLHTEGVDSAATASISHEKLFEAWPSLNQYVKANKKQLIDLALLESRAKKWHDMGRPWFDGLASGREQKDFRRAGGTATLVVKDYLATSRRAGWLRVIAFLLVALVIGGPIAWLETQNVTVRYAKSIVLVRLHLVSIPEPTMVEVSAGTYKQGSLEQQDEQPVREVTIKPFEMGKYEVTFEEYDRYVELTGAKRPEDAGWGRGRRPVINVSWDDAKAYAQWLSRATGKPYRLPTESEWEYAARNKEKDDPWAGISDESQLRGYAVFASNQTEPVGEPRIHNGRGLYDMSGNVWEWVEDCWHGTYDGAPKDGSAWRDADKGDCGLRVLRGGSWGDGPVDLRVSGRVRGYAGSRRNDVGFRLAQDLEP